jgi:HEAT repeat protein
MNASFNRVIASLLAVSLLVVPCIAATTDTSTALKTAVNGSGKSQYKAIDDLGGRHEAAPTVVPKLQQLLKSSDAQVRWRSARALGDYESLAKDTAGDLRTLLKDKDPVVQYHAAIALGKVGDKSEETTLALVDAATSKDSRVARAAISALRNLKPGPEKVAAALKEALKSNDQAITLHALEALIEMGPKAVPLLKEGLKQPETAYLACTAIEQIGPEAADTVPELTELLGKTKHSQLLIQTLLALASIGPQAQPAESAIVPLLESSTDETVPVAAAYALGSIGAKDADAALKSALEKKDPFLHMVATWARAKLHPDDQQLLKQAVDELTKGLANKDAQIRTAAAKGLQMLQPPSEVLAPALMAVANDPNPDVATNIVSAFAGLGEAVVPRATKALKNEDPKARALAVRVLTKLGPKASGAVPGLIDASKDTDPEFRSKVYLALAAIGPAAGPATEALTVGISSNDKRISESALYALREIGPGAKAAIRPLLRRAEADKSFDSLAAAWALSRIAPDNGAIAARIIPVLVRGLSNSDEQIRLNSAEAIAEWGPAATQATAELKKAARDDKSAAVRAAAEVALKRVAGRS